MKKLNKFFAVLVALAMMATLCVSMAFAANPPAPSETNLVKYLEVAEGVSVPDVTFTFTFTPNTAASSIVDASDLTAANPGSQTIRFNEGYGTTEANDGASVYKAVPVATLNNVTKAGVYAYTVTESTYTFNGAEDTTKAIVQNPDAKSYVVRYVVKNVDGVPTVTGITVQDAVTDDKVDATTEDPTENDNPETTTVVEYDGFTFRNTYQKTEGDGTLANAPLKVSKAVDGDANAPDAAFPFSITLTKAYGAPETAPTAQVYEGTTPVGDPITVAYGTTPVGFNLKAGQTLVFLNLPAGTSYLVSENLTGVADFAAFAPSYKVNENTAVEPATAEATGSADYGVTLATNTLRVAEGDKDLVAYTNTYESEINTPTGILISNLPYIALALIAIGGLVAYVVVRRKADDEA